MLSTIDVIEVDFLVVDVVELDVLGVRRLFTYTNLIFILLKISPEVTPLKFT
jgi:hypothetical protein